METSPTNQGPVDRIRAQASDSMFWGVTLPPYRILMVEAVLLSQPVSMNKRIERCTVTACSVVAARPVPMAQTGS